jgi:hypothetical protein
MGASVQNFTQLGVYADSLRPFILNCVYNFTIDTTKEQQGCNYFVQGYHW